jgi:DNA polymerase III alpha subunit (gram-positive type)
MENKERVELCCHTKMSKLQGINDAKEYIEEAIKRGYKSIAITDTNSTQGFFNAEKYLKLYASKPDFKIIYGTEMHFISETYNKLYTIYIYVKEQKGLKNLYKLISKAYKNIQNEIPILHKKDLLEYREGLLFAAIGNESEVYQNVENSNIKNIIDFYDFIGIEPNESNKNINIRINELCKKYNKILIGTSECNFINKEDFKCNEILNFYKKSSNIENGNNNYFKTTDELLNNFNYIENSKEIVIDNTIKISEQIEKIDLIVKKASYPKIENADMIIETKCYNKAKELYGDNIPKEVTERLQLELNSIKANNFESIYLIFSELVQYSNELGYEVGCRGSVGNSFVAYLLEITNINPLEYNLPFEFFAGKNYDRKPDIDLNFSRKIQSKIFTYLQKKFGKDKVIWAGTVGSIADRTIENSYNEYINFFGIKDKSDKESIIRKILGVKKCTGEHPGGVFIIAENMEITDICPIEIGEKNHLKTHNDYHTLEDTGLYKFDILGHDDPTMLHELEKETNISSKNIKLDDTETLNMFFHANDKLYPTSTNGIPEFENTYTKKLLEISKPHNFNDLVCISALLHDSLTGKSFPLIENEHKKVDEVISNRADMLNYLINYGIEKNIAFDIVEFVRTGKALKKKVCENTFENEYKEFNEKWDEYKKILQAHNIPEWYIQDAEKIRYMFPKSHAIGYTANEFKIAWYKVHYPKAFYKAYFKIKSNVSINDYYCKRQVKTELNRLYDLKEKHEKNFEIYYDYNNDNKIRDLELMLEMFDRGILKEKQEIKDDYNLINSRAIADYCRSIKHKFNTEELAVLVFRNKRMSITEKIDKYEDLINNYPDMEVIERFNCEHYDSVKTMIKNEIQRLKNMVEILQKDDNSVYTFSEYNEYAGKYLDYNELNYSRGSFKEIEKDVYDYISKYDEEGEIKSFKIKKVPLKDKTFRIIAIYKVENKKLVLTEIYDDVDSYYELDINNIFLNIPNPFKKGDILTDGSKVMVLEWLCTEQKNLDVLLAKGFKDSSDMQGACYFINEYDNLTADNIFDYDSWEYFDGNLEGMNRLLKPVSEYIKNEIAPDLFLDMYEYIKISSNNHFNWYTEEYMEKLGLSKEEIKMLNK